MRASVTLGNNCVSDGTISPNIATPIRMPAAIARSSEISAPSASIEPPGQKAHHACGADHRPDQQSELPTDQDQRGESAKPRQQRHQEPSDHARLQPAGARQTVRSRPRRRSGWRSPDRAAGRSAAAWSRPARTRSRTAPARRAGTWSPARGGRHRPRASPGPQARRPARMSARTAGSSIRAARRAIPGRCATLPSRS